MGKAMKMWHEPEKPAGVAELLALINMREFVLCWNGLYRQWELWETRKRWKTGTLPVQIPYNAAFKRWRHEIGKILDSRIENAA